MSNSGRSGPANLPFSSDRGDDVRRVKEATDIVRLIGEHLALKNKGRELAGLCPFHDDHSPSMYVVPAKQIFHCFVCGAGGDAISFVQRYHAMEFREALEYLAQKAGIELTPPQARAQGATTETPRASLLAANATACEFFRAILRHPEHGKAARGVVEKRGISQEMVELFQLGAAPDRWDGLLLTIQNKSLDATTFLRAGLLKPREGGSGNYDALRNRLIFPIHDGIGRVIAFGARRINDADEPKYLNSPETALFNKSATLYGLFQASRAIQSQRTAIVTEGYTDTIACHQAGLTNAVATLGTALTVQHAAVLRRLCDRVVLLFDGDEAGQRASERALEVFLSQPLDVRLATLNGVTDAKDPDELLKREGGLEILKKAIEQSVDLLEYRMNRVRARLAGAGIAAMSRGIEEELARFTQLGLANVEPLRRRLIIQRLAQIAGVDEPTILAMLPAASAGRARSAQITTQNPGRPLSVAEHLLGCLLADGHLWADTTQADRDRLAQAIEHGEHRGDGGQLAQILRAALSAQEDEGTPDLTSVLDRLADPALAALATGLCRQVQRATDDDQARLRLHRDACVRTLAAQDSPSPEAGASVFDRMELKRQSHAEFGGNPRALPKP